MSYLLRTVRESRRRALMGTLTPVVFVTYLIALPMQRGSAAAHR